jgi:hypothetical protein
MKVKEAAAAVPTAVKNEIIREYYSKLGRERWRGVSREEHAALSRKGAEANIKRLLREARAARKGKKNK